eukprot:scaffold6055_cov99-Skeletonema_marinoi.AAC.3
MAMVEAFERLAFSRFVGAILDNFGELSDEDGHLFQLSYLHPSRFKIRSIKSPCAQDVLSAVSCLLVLQ